MYNNTYFAYIGGEYYGDVDYHFFNYIKYQAKGQLLYIATYWSRIKYTEFSFNYIFSIVLYTIFYFNKIYIIYVIFCKVCIEGGYIK